MQNKANLNYIFRKQLADTKIKSSNENNTL